MIIVRKVTTTPYPSEDSCEHVVPGNNVMMHSTTRRETQTETETEDGVGVGGSYLTLVEAKLQVENIL